MSINIRPSIDLRNHYNEISKTCNEYHEPVFITKNGKGDLAVMSIELFNQLAGKQELFRQLNEGLEAMHSGDTIPYETFMNDLRQRI